MLVSEDEEWRLFDLLDLRDLDLNFLSWDLDLDLELDLELDGLFGLRL